MTLTPGARLGPYRIVAAVGAGGMGEVYRARDTRLDRDVAVKVLPEARAGDAARVARFRLEARAVAALSHPNILAIFDTGVHEGRAYVVTELLQGETLRTRLDAGALPVRKAVEIAVQIARGLSAAHDKGIVHRDLKPENVFILRDGQVKILDFGLARTLYAAGTGETPTMAVTDPGAVMGTAGYMAPEQVRGHAVDARSDLFTFGTVLYELLSGRRAFRAETPAETMTAVLKADPPDLMRVRPDLPPALDRIVRHCLEKHPQERFQTARDVAFALESLSGSDSRSNSVAIVEPGRRSFRQALAILAAVALATAAFFAGRQTAPTPTSPELQYEVKTFDPQAIFNARFMPDGRTIVYSAALNGNAPELFVSRANELAPQALGQKNTHLLAVSAKGELAVLADAGFINHRLFSGTLARMPIDGEPRRTMTNVRDADWSPDGSQLAVIRFGNGTDRLEYPAGTVLHQAGGYLSDPRVSPDGTRVAFFEHPIPFDNRGWVKVVDRTGAVTTLAGEYWGLEGLAWTPGGASVFFSEVEAFGRYHVRTVPATGQGEARQALAGLGSAMILDVAADGRWLASLIRDERLSLRALVPGATEEREYPWLSSPVGPSLSKDGRLLLFTDQSQSAGNNYATAYRRMDGGQPIRLGEGDSSGFSPDGAWALATVPNPPALIVYPVGPGNPVRLDRGPIDHYRTAKWFPDGQRVLFCGNEPSKPVRCYQQRVAGGPPTPVTPEGTIAAIAAPDGHTLLTTKADGGFELASTEGGATRPARGMAPEDVAIAWSRDGRTLFVQQRASNPALIERVNPITGERVRVREVAPPDRAGLVGVRVGDVLDDGAGYAYQYRRQTSSLAVSVERK